MFRVFLIFVLAGAACEPATPTDTGLDTGKMTDFVEPRLALPLVETDLVAVPVIGVDHDPEVYDGIYRLVCTNYNGEGFPLCYDEHDGTDFLLVEGFTTMDAGSVSVTAAAAGTVTSVEDGHYDRCHGDLETMDVDCDGHEMKGNHVIIEHDEGWSTRYWHFMADSITVSEGDQVESGDFLGLVGSSGYSTTPHLHFELQDPDGESVDPYAGEYSQPDTWWCDQGDPEGLPGSCD